MVSCRFLGGVLSGACRDESRGFAESLNAKLFRDSILEGFCKLSAGFLRGICRLLSVAMQDSCGFCRVSVPGIEAVCVDLCMGFSRMSVGCV